MNGILGRKVGMTQVFTEDGRAVPVTVIEAGPCTVTAVKNPERDGYAAVQLGFRPATPAEQAAPGPCAQGHRQQRHPPARTCARSAAAPRARSSASASPWTWYSAKDDVVDVIGTSKGKGFQGGVKRWHFRGGPKTHGQSDRHRAPGSIGAGTTPGRVLKGQKMAGHMGHERVDRPESYRWSISTRRIMCYWSRAPYRARATALVMVRKAVKK